jgi:hypothetical protein
LLTDFVCLYIYEFWFSLWKIVRSSVILLLPLSQPRGHIIYEPTPFFLWITPNQSDLKMCCYNTIQSPKGALWSWSYGSWIYNYLCNQFLLPLMLWVRTLFMARCTGYNIMWSSLTVTLLVSSTNKTDHHDITEILLKVVLNTIYQIKRNQSKQLIQTFDRCHIQMNFQIWIYLKKKINQWDSFTFVMQ